MSVKLELVATGWRGEGRQATQEENLAIRWKVRNVGVFKEEVEVWTAGGNEPVFHITGRKVEYKSKEDALTALQKEVDAA